MGRTSDFTPEIANEICERISKGESLRAICAGDAHTEGAFMPGRSTVMRWLNENEAFRDQYAHAREAQADHFVEEIIEIADQPSVMVTADGDTIANDPQRDRLRVDARKWVAARLAPKKYGDKIAHVGGGEGDAPIKTKIDLSGLSQDQLKVLAAIGG